ncbi:hypothetical protein BDW66DRAFT_160334 [Aspergillus desertorum]
MNFNTSVFPNAVKPLSEAFNISEQHARTAQMAEEFCRWPILQLSMFLINIWQIPCALAPNWGTIVVCVLFMTLGLIADLYEKGWGFGTLGQAWAVIPINLAYFLAYFSYLPFFRRDKQLRKQIEGDDMLPERRLKYLLWLAPLEPIGLFGFAWTSVGKSRGVPWIASMIFSTCVGIANFAIYLSTVDYMVAAHGVYSASATGGNAFARDLLAGISAMYATPMYTNIGDKWHVEYASTVLACLSCLVVIPIYVFYWKGPQIRASSKFAQALEAENKTNQGRRVSRMSSQGWGSV